MNAPLKLDNPVEHIRAFHKELTDIRRDIHAHPELGFNEQRTSDLVAATLESWGIEVHRGIAKTGLVGVLANDKAIVGKHAQGALHRAEAQAGLSRKFAFARNPIAWFPASVVDGCR